MKFSNKDYVPFHVHSEFSCFDGLAKLWDLTMAAREMGFPAMALTDHGNVGGWIKFIRHAKATQDKKGNDIPHPPIKPILGSEFYLCRDHTFKSKDKQPDAQRGNRHLNLYAMNWKGYQNVCALSQAAYRDGFYFNPRIDIQQLSEHSEGVMCGSACISSVINNNLLHLEKGGYDKAKQAAGTLNEIFNGNFFLEVMYHGLEEEREITPNILKISQELSIPAICTNDVHYIKRAHGPSQELLMCMSTNMCLKDPKHLHFPYNEFYLKSAEEMGKIFSGRPDLIYNSVAMADRIDTDDITHNLFSVPMRLPAFDIPEGFSSPYEYLTKLAWEGLEGLGWHKSQKHIDRLKKELQDIQVAMENNKLDFSTYFLIVRDYIGWTKSQGWLTGGGRGSGYASVLLRCLGICYGPDPLEYGLLWERFLGFDNLYFVSENDYDFEPISDAV